MPKKSKKQTDEDEKKVIAQLQKNPRESINEIAKKCGFSRQKVWRILNKFEKDKTIWGYNVVTDDKKLDVKRYIMLIKSSPKAVNSLVDKISNLTLQKMGGEIGIDVESGGYVHGKYDWTLVFTARDIKHAKIFSELLLKEFSPIINKVDILEYIFTIKKYGVVNPEINKLGELFLKR